MPGVRFELSSGSQDQNANDVVAHLACRLHRDVSRINKQSLVRSQLPHAWSFFTLCVPIRSAAVIIQHTTPLNHHVARPTTSRADLQNHRCAPRMRLHHLPRHARLQLPRRCPRPRRPLVRHLLPRSAPDETLPPPHGSARGSE